LIKWNSKKRTFNVATKGHFTDQREDCMEFKKNDYVTVKIEDIGNDGEGIGKHEGFTLFVKGALPGDVAKVKVLKAKKTYYVKVRTYKTVSGKKYYSDWSGYKTVKTK
jgi:predicted RNA-binding protein with TRAM domain